MQWEGAMPRILRSMAFLMCAAGMGGVSAPAVAATAALVVAAQGAIQPAVEEFAEADEGARFDLGADGELILMYYAACSETHFRGGVVTVEALDVVTTGERVNDAPVECPSRVTLAEAPNAVAATVLRGEGDGARIAQRPVFVLLSADARAVEIRRGGALLQRLPVEGRLARWPADAGAAN